MAADQRNWFLARFRYRLWIDHSSQLCLVGLGRPASGRIVYRERGALGRRRRQFRNQCFAAQAITGLSVDPIEAHFFAE